MSGADIVREEAGTAERVFVDAGWLAWFVQFAEDSGGADLSEQARHLFGDES